MVASLTVINPLYPSVYYTLGNSLYELGNYKEAIISYKKLIPARRMFKHSTIVTFDDDIIYEPWRLKVLLECADIYPGCIIGFRGKTPTFSLFNEINSYKDWPYAALTSNQFLTILTGCGGILYPPIKDYDQLIQNYQLAVDLGKTCDDVFFWACALSKSIPRICLGFNKEKEISYTKFNPRLGHINNNPSSCVNDIAISSFLNHYKIIFRK